MNKKSEERLILNNNNIEEEIKTLSKDLIVLYNKTRYLKDEIRNIRIILIFNVIITLILLILIFNMWSSGVKLRV